MPLYFPSTGVGDTTQYVIHAEAFGVVADHVADSGTWLNHATATAYAGTTDDTAALGTAIETALTQNCWLEFPARVIRVTEAAGLPFEIDNTATEGLFWRGYGVRTKILVDGATDYVFKIEKSALFVPSGPEETQPGSSGCVVIDGISIVGAGRNEEDVEIDGIAPNDGIVAQRGMQFNKLAVQQDLVLRNLTYTGLWGTALHLGNDTSGNPRESHFHDIRIRGCGSLTEPAMIIGSPLSGGPNNLRLHDTVCSRSRWVGLHCKSLAASANDNEFHGLRCENNWGPAQVYEGEWLQLSVYDSAVKSNPISAENDAEHYVKFVMGSRRVGTAQAGAASTITLAADTVTAGNLFVGDFVLLTGGTGSGQLRQASGYDDPTKVLTITVPWATVPDATTTYKIGRYPRNVIWQGSLSGCPNGMLIEGGREYDLKIAGGAGIRSAGSLLRPILTLGAGVHGKINVNFQLHAGSYMVESHPDASRWLIGHNEYMESVGAAWTRRRFVRKLGDNIRVSTTTVAPDEELEQTLDQDATYYIQAVLNYHTVAAAGFKFSFTKTGTAVTGSSITYRHMAPSAYSYTEVTTTFPLTNIAVTGGGTGPGRIVIEGYITLAAVSTDNVLKLEWAQNASNASPTVLLLGSSMGYQKCSIA